MWGERLVRARVPEVLYETVCPKKDYRNKTGTMPIGMYMLTQKREISTLHRTAGS